MAKQFDQKQDENTKSVETKLQQPQPSQSDDQSQEGSNSKQEKSKTIKKKDKNKGKEINDPEQAEKPLDGSNDEENLSEEINHNQKIQEGEAFMLPEQREIEKNHPRYHFCRFISRHYRLIEDKKDRKNHFIRMQPVFVRFLHVLKLHNLPLITIDTFRKYFKKFCKRRGIKYDETTNRVDMKVVVGIDRRYNSKFQF